MTIGDNVEAVASLLGGRTDLNDRISGWLADGYRDLGDTVPFETLEQTSDNLCVYGIGEMTIQLMLELLSHLPSKYRLDHQHHPEGYINVISTS